MKFKSQKLEKVRFILGTKSLFISGTFDRVLIKSSPKVRKKLRSIDQEMRLIRLELRFDATIENIGPN